ncbi:MAG TPA: hypothetical protein VFF53_13285 [Geobacteraceae bacterium]|nr:hypothetical protein [Geobacteraceae bacterium]
MTFSDKPSLSWKGRTGKWLILFIVISLVAWRSPMLLLEPRFWAEDGAMYFATAYNDGVAAGLFSPHDGYYAFLPNLGGTIASFLPLEYAPLMMTMTAYLLQVGISSLLIFGNSRFWGTLPSKIILAVGLMLLAHGETWLNVSNSQYWFCVGTFIILLESKTELSKTRGWIYRLFTLFSGLSSVTSNFLLPMLLLKAWRSRVREEWVHAAILSATTLVQLSVLLFCVAGSDDGFASRFAHRYVFSLLGVSLFNLVYPFTSQSFFDLPALFALDRKIVLTLINVVGKSDYNWPRPSEVVLSVVAGICVVSEMWRRRKNSEMLLITGAFIIVTLLSTVLSINMVSSPRYALAPSFMLLTLLIGELQLSGGFVKVVCLLMLGLFLLLSPLDYKNNVCFDPRFPKWREELNLWRNDPSHKIRIWPQHETNHWEMELKR